MTSRYIKQEWLPSEWGRYDCEGILDDYEGFRILARGKVSGSPVFRIRFDTVVAYRYVDEGDCFNDQRRGPGFVQDGITFLVEESWFSQEIEETTSGVREAAELQHFAFYFANDCIDVVSLDAPIVEDLSE